MNFNTRTITKLAVIALAATSLSACASKPKPGPMADDQGPQQPYYPPAGNSGGGGPGVVPGSVQDFVVNVGDRVYFDFDSYSIREDAKPVLAAQSGWLRRYGSVRVRIEGNCDERGTREYNLALGARRANAVKNFLVAQGVDPSRIGTLSYGKERPLDGGDSEDAWARNRNGHSVIVDGAR
jgi:peptidoglycan-associated lipoprotein